MKHWSVAASLLLAAVCVACAERQDNATTSSLPAMQTTIGPVPGPGQHVNVTDNPLGKDPVALQEGRRLFVRFNCSGCHGGHGGGGMGPSLRDVTWLYGHRDADVFSSIAQGRGRGMPAWGTKLPQEQIWKLVAYIQSMRKPYEADPPS